MAHLTDIPKHHEIWAGGPSGLRLRRHPQLSSALEYLDEYPMVIRRCSVITASLLKASDAPTITLASLPVYRRSSVGETVELYLQVDCPPMARQGWIHARVLVESADTTLQEYIVVKPGQRQYVTMPFPAFAADTALSVRLELREHGQVQSSFTLRPEKRLTFYYAFQTHLDLGWTGRVAPTIASLKKMTSEVAVKVCRQFSDRPRGQQFVWTCECSDALRLAWEGADPRQREDLRQFIRQGLIQCCALPFSFYTELMSHDLLRRALDRSFNLRREIGVEELDLSVAQSNDVPGHSWIVPDVLAEKGIARAIIGHNSMVRGCQLPPLFIWQGPGGGRVLTLATSCVDYGAVFPIPQNPRDLWGLSANNPQALSLPGTAMMRSLGYGENCGPENAQRELAAIDAWNEAYVWPKLVIAGPKDYFNHLEPQINVDALPIVTREISDWWVDGAASTPRAMSQYRKAMIALPRLEQAVPPHQAEDRRRLATIEENLILHAEHTFGLNAQLVRPRASTQNWKLDGLDDYVGSWEDKETYAATAAELVKDLNHRYPPALEPSSHAPWDIRWDERGITRLADAQGRCWYERALLTDAPPFAGVMQQLLGEDLGEWYHHNPPAAPHAGTYAFNLESIAAVESARGHGVVLSGRLNSPAGAIGAVQVTLRQAPDSPDLLIEVAIRNKQATAQAECLTLALPFLCAEPGFLTDVGQALLKVDQDQLPDANRDAHPVITGWILEDRQTGDALAISSADAFLWHFGDRRYCQWNKAPAQRSATAYAHLLNNVWNTNFRCWIDGDLDYAIRIRRCGPDRLAELAQMASRWEVS